MRRTALLTLLALAAALAGVGATQLGDASSAATPTRLRDVMWVGNNWAGTASIVDAKALKVLKRGVDLVRFIGIARALELPRPAPQSATPGRRVLVL